jgi:hypothetical protein
LRFEVRQVERGLQFDFAQVRVRRGGCHCVHVLEVLLDLFLRAGRLLLTVCDCGWWTLSLCLFVGR